MWEKIGSVSDIVSATASVLTLVFSIVILLAYRKREDNKIIYEISQRLYEADKLIIEHPEIQVILKANLASTGGMEESIGRSEDYYKVKSYVYMWLNVIDEMISTVQNEGKKFKKALGYERWEKYFGILLRHPFFKGICEKEKHIFGAELEKWLEKSKDILEQPLSESDLKIF